MRHICCFIAEIWLQKESSKSISFGIKNSNVRDSRRQGNFWGPHGWRGSLELQNPREKALPKSWHYSRLQGSSTKWAGERMQCLLVINKSMKFQKSYCTGDVSTQSNNLKTKPLEQAPRVWSSIVCIGDCIIAMTVVTRLDKHNILKLKINLVIVSQRDLQLSSIHTKHVVFRGTLNGRYLTEDLRFGIEAA